MESDNEQSAGVQFLKCGGQIDMADDMLNALTQKIIEQGNVTPLKDLYRRFISDCENNGYKITELQDEVTIENCGEPIAAPYSSQFDYMGMWLKHLGLDTLSEYENQLK